MEPVKVVVRYLNGKVIKGVTQDFSPNKDRFHLHQAAKLRRIPGSHGERAEGPFLRSGFRRERPV